MSVRTRRTAASCSPWISSTSSFSAPRAARRLEPAQQVRQVTLGCGQPPHHRHTFPLAAFLDAQLGTLLLRRNTGHFHGRADTLLFQLAAVLAPQRTIEWRAFKEPHRDASFAAQQPRRYKPAGTARVSSPFGKWQIASDKYQVGREFRGGERMLLDTTTRSEPPVRIQTGIREVLPLPWHLTLV